jgi:hypothetical protein
MKNWLIKKLGGYTRQEYAWNRAEYDRTVEAMRAAGSAVFLEHGVLSNSEIRGTLIVAPDSYATLMNCHFEIYEPLKLTSKSSLISSVVRSSPN